jgi:SAM-dependent methyltransferase
VEFRQTDVDHFRRGEYENPRFWCRFGESPDLSGATILDVGSGWGSLCVDMALAGARKIVGVDIKSELIDFANEYLKQNYPRLTNVVEFRAVDLREYDEVTFDYIVSKDSFEHIIDLDGMLSEMKKRLRLGGRIYAGFGPLYTSPYGDHDRRHVVFRPWGLWGHALALIPWGHLFMESLIIDMNNRYRERKVNSICDLGLNRMSVSDYRRVFYESELSIISFRLNQSTSVQSRVLSLLGKIPCLEDYCIHNCYCILEKSK